MRASKPHMTQLRIFDYGNFPEPTVKTLTHMYERFDGHWFPGRILGKEIPPGSRDCRDVTPPGCGFAIA